MVMVRWDRRVWLDALRDKKEAWGRLPESMHVVFNKRDCLTDDDNKSRVQEVMEMHTELGCSACEQ